MDRPWTEITKNNKGPGSENQGCQVSADKPCTDRVQTVYGPCTDRVQAVDGDYENNKRLGSENQGCQVSADKLCTDRVQKPCTDRGRRSRKKKRPGFENEGC